MEPIMLTVSSVGQITLPSKVRKLLNLEKGSKLEVKVDPENQLLTLKRQMTHKEVFAKLEEFHKTLPKPDPRSRHMTVGEMVEEELKLHPLENDTWV